MELDKKLHDIKPFNLSTQTRLVEKRNRKRGILGKLSILVGHNKRGDIIIREGDNPNLLVKNFMISYSLNKELFTTILGAVLQLILNATKKKTHKLEVMGVNRKDTHGDEYAHNTQNNIEKAPTPSGSAMLNEIPLNVSISPLSSTTSRNHTNPTQISNSSTYLHRDKMGDMITSSPANLMLFGHRSTSNIPLQPKDPDLHSNSSIYIYIYIIDSPTPEISTSNRSHTSNQENKGQINTKGDIMFRLNFELGGDRSSKISVHQGENLNTLAENFVISHKLGNSMYSKVLHLLQHTYQVLYIYIYIYRHI